MVPINEVLIAKIVLGYLSSRELSNTADCFVKECEGFHHPSETGNCEKERILNHLEGLNLLPSLEEILNDYFAYKGPDDHATDKVYMLWKQLDVVIGQLRAITLGKTKSKAFMNSRRAPKTYNKLVEKAENSNQSSINQYIVNSSAVYNGAMTDLQDTPKVPLKDIGHGNLLFGSSGRIIQNKLSTPVKDNLLERHKKEIRSPRRKTRHPRRNANGDTVCSNEEKVQSVPVEVPNDAHLNKEFSDLVAALISNDKLSTKLADNINKVVSVEPKPPCKENEDIVDEIIKLTADDPDLNILFSMLGGQPIGFHDTTHNNFDINSDLVPSSFNMVSSVGGSYIELQPTVTSVSHERVEVVDSNLQSTFSSNQSVDSINPSHMKSVETNNQALSIQPSSFPNFFELMSSEYSCMRDLSDAFSVQTSDAETNPEPKKIDENTSLVKIVDIAPPEQTPKTDHQFPSPNKILISPVSVSSERPVENSLSKAMNDKTVDCKKNKEIVEDNEILASHALLQLSTSPMKISTSNKIGNVISKPPVFPQALTSNGKVSREPICSTNYTIRNKSNDIAAVRNEMPSQVDEEPVHKDISLPACSQPKELNVTQHSTTCENPHLSSGNSFDGKNLKRKKVRKKRVKSKGMTPEKMKVISTISSCEHEDTVQKKPKRSKEILVKQLDFNPQATTLTSNRQSCSNDKASIERNSNNLCYFAPLVTTSTINPLQPTCSIVPIIYPQITLASVCDELSPAAILSAQLNSQNSKNAKSQFHSNVSVHNSKHMSSKPAPKKKLSKTQWSHVSSESSPLKLSKTQWSHVSSESSPLKSSNDQFQTFRIKGNAISKVNISNHKTNIEHANSANDFSCKSKTLSMVISNTDSLTKISNCSKDGSSSPEKSNGGIEVPLSSAEKISSDQHTSTTSTSTTYSSSFTNFTNFSENIVKDPVPSVSLDLKMRLNDIDLEKEEEKCVAGAGKLEADSFTMNKACLNENKKILSGKVNDNAQDLPDNLLNSVGCDTSDIRENEDKCIATEFNLKCHVDKDQYKSVPSKAVAVGSKKKEKISLGSKTYKNVSSKRMTVKFNFSRSPSRRRSTSNIHSVKNVDISKENVYGNPDSVTETIDVHQVLCESTENALTNYSNETTTSIISSTSNSSVTTFSRNHEKHTTSVVECLKESCYFQVSSSNNPDSNKLNKENLRNLPSDNEDSPSTSQTNANQSLVKECKEDAEIEKKKEPVHIKHKGKRKRRLSMLMLNIDNVAQLLSGIDYS